MFLYEVKELTRHSINGTVSEVEFRYVAVVLLVTSSTGWSKDQCCKLTISQTGLQMIS